MPTPSGDMLKDGLLSKITSVAPQYPTRILERSSGVFIRHSFSFLHGCTSSALESAMRTLDPGNVFLKACCLRIVDLVSPDIV